MKKKLQATVLIYTLILVTISVLMSLVVLNLSIDLSRNYEVQKISTTILSIIKTKSQLATKYAREVNDSGNGFTDTISCPQNISMIGDTQSTPSLAMDFIIENSLAYCRSSTQHNGSFLEITFRSDYSDILYALYQGSQVTLGGGVLIGNFTDADNTVIDLGSNAYLSADGIDDNLDSDDYQVSSSGGVNYPNSYIDNDADARLNTYGYITPDSGLYNIFWSFDEYISYIEANTNNNDTLNDTLTGVNDAIVYLEFDQSYRLILYRIDKAQFNTTNEMLVNQVLEGSSQAASIGYLQNTTDLSLSATKTGNEYIFDFVNYDYVLFAENLSGDALLLYQIRAEQNTNGRNLYITPIKDDDPAIMSFLGSHVYVSSTGQLISEVLEIFTIK